MISGQNRPALEISILESSPKYLEIKHVSLKHDMI